MRPYRQASTLPGKGTLSVRYVSTQGAARWQRHHEPEDVPLRLGDVAEVLVFGSGLVGATGLALVGLWRL